MCYQLGQQVVSIGGLSCRLCKKREQVVHQLLVPRPAVVVVHHLQPVLGHFLKKVCHASVSGGYANILFRKARAACAAAAASSGGGSTAVQPRFSSSTGPLPSSTRLNRGKPLCEVPDPNEHAGLCCAVPCNWLLMCVVPSLRPCSFAAPSALWLAVSPSCVLPCAVRCSWLLCCAALLRIVPRCPVLFCATLFRLVLFSAAWYLQIQVQIQILDRNPSGDTIDVNGAF